MKKLYDGVQRFCAMHPRFGIPNLMRVIVCGNVAVYVKYNAVPTVDSHDFTSNRAGNAEVIRIAQPKTGTYYIKLVGAAAFTNVTVQADQ